MEAGKAASTSTVLQFDRSERSDRNPAPPELLTAGQIQLLTLTWEFQTFSFVLVTKVLRQELKTTSVSLNRSSKLTYFPGSRLEG